MANGRFLACRKIAPQKALFGAKNDVFRTDQRACGSHAAATCLPAVSPGGSNRVGGVSWVRVPCSRRLPECPTEQQRPDQLINQLINQLIDQLIKNQQQHTHTHERKQDPLYRGRLAIIFVPSLSWRMITLLFSETSENVAQRTASVLSTPWPCAD